MYNKILIISFCFCIGIVLVLSLIIPNVEFSNNENRYLQKLPTFTFANLYNGSYTKDFESYISDNVAFRDEFVSLKTLTEISIGKKDNTRVYFGENSRLFEINKDIDQNNINKNISDINKFSNTLKDKYNINVQIMIAPTASLIYREMLPKYAKVNDEEKYITYIYDKINYTYINVVDSLKQNKNKDIYFRLDHHWTQNGAYLAYEEWKKINKIDTNIQYDIQKMSNEFYGTLYSKANNYFLKPDDIEIYINQKAKYNVIYDKDKKTNNVYEMSNLFKKDKYTVFLDGNHSIVEINTDVDNNKHLLVIKDSYAHSLIPLLSNHYSKITVLDLRYINNISEYINNSDYTDCMFIYNIYNFSSKDEFVKLNNVKK